MKSYNRPIRMSKAEHIKRLKDYDKRWNEDSRLYGVTNWSVGTNYKPWHTWIQIHFGYFSIQIKYYLIILALMALSFVVSKLI